MLRILTAALAAALLLPTAPLGAQTPQIQLDPGSLTVPFGMDSFWVDGMVTEGPTEDVSVFGAPDGVTVDVIPGRQLEGVELAAELPGYEVGELIGLGRIEGARIVEGGPECDGPHLVAQDDAITIDGNGPLSPPQGEGCEYGAVLTVNGPLLGGTTPQDATFADGAFGLDITVDHASPGTYELTVVSQGAGSAEAVLPLTVDAAQARARSLDAACPPGDVPAPPFEDVAADHAHRTAIACAAWWRITLGTGPGLFDPAATVPRGQMATFVARLLISGGRLLPPSPPDAFGDDDGHEHELAINQLAATGVISGTGERTFDPEDPVTRAQMATFLVQAVAYRLGGELPANADFFGDDDGSPHEVNINRAAQAGFAAGISANGFGPGRRLQRAQMTAFLMRVEAFLVARGATVLPTVLLTPLPSPFNVDIDGDGDDELVTEDPQRGRGSGEITDGDLDGNPDGVTVGTAPSGRIIGKTDIDGDGDEEVLVEDPNLSGYERRDLDGDGDPDTVVIGTFPRGYPRDTFDLDGDGDDEVIVENPDLAQGNGVPTVVNIDGTNQPGGDEDGDVVVIGTYPTDDDPRDKDQPRSRVRRADLDGDGEPEAVVERTRMQPGTAQPVNIDGDGDNDVVGVGTLPGGKIRDVTDRDDDGDEEVIIDDPSRPAGEELELDVDGDGDADVIWVGTRP